MLKWCGYFFVCCLLTGCQTPPQKIAITFDDYPMESRRGTPKGDFLSLYLDKLEQLEIQAAFFCVGCQVGSEEMLAQAAKKKQFLANHSTHHPHLSQISLKTFTQEVLETDHLLKPHATYQKWFRFPYLDYGDRAKTGGSHRKHVGAFQILRNLGYAHGYITINTFDWHVNQRMIRALKKGEEVHWERLRAAYLFLLSDWIDQYHASWKRILKRPFCHVLLLHQNDLNLLFLEDIKELILSKGWEIVSPEEAYQKPIPILARFGHTPLRFRHPTSLTLSHIDEVLEEAFNLE